jgi:hypothetical protein
LFAFFKALPANFSIRKPRQGTIRIILTHRVLIIPVFVLS